MIKIQPVRGTHDLFGDDLIKYKFIEKTISILAHYYDFDEIITPIFEHSKLFEKHLGTNSDVVLKEMYSFEDRNKKRLTLRPEYTTPMIRAAISNNLLNNLPVKLFSTGPMFRRERPQKGRYRQFSQINFEIFGTNDTHSDCELILLANDFLKKLKLNKYIKLHLNSLGDPNTLEKYKKLLKDYFQKYYDDLSEESKSKIKLNPLRILDSKDRNDIEISNSAPKINTLYTKEAIKNFDSIQQALIDSGIVFQKNHNLVRGLDYYCHTVFEFKTDKLGSQNTIIGGGRYDGLIRSLGGPDLPGVGWAGGIERLMMMIDHIKNDPPLIQLIILDEKSKNYGLEILSKLRKHKIKCRHTYKYNLKKSLKLANDSKIKYALIVGENEIKINKYTLKDLVKGTQKSLELNELIKVLK